MKKFEPWIIFTIGIMIHLLSGTIPLSAQAPQSISYQAIVRDADGNPLANQLVSVQITLHQSSEAGAEVYCETHSVTTNLLGLVNLQIGEGMVVFGSFPAITWESGIYYLELELDPAGGTAYVPMGTTQLVSVPYALYSEKTGQTFSAGEGIDISDGTITNTAPDQLVNLYNGLGISVSGAYPELTITNTLPDQPVFLFNGAGIDVSGTYPAFTIANSSPDQVINLNPGSGIAVSGTYPDFTVTNTAPNASHSGDATGSEMLTVAGIQGRPVSATAPTVDQVFQWNGAQWQPATLSGGSAPAWSLTGNGGTNPAANFLGTTDNQPLIFRVNNLPAGEINPINDNTFLGKQAGDNSTGNGNAAIGSMALYNNSTGYLNTASGFSTLYTNSTGSWNTASGDRALYSNTTGPNNTATGALALYSNQTGVANTASGSSALYSNTTGNYNSAHGPLALYSNTTGRSNVAVGIGALYNNTTRNNLVAIGDSALFKNGQGASSPDHATKNTALGSKALFSNTTGYENTATGSNTLNANISGNRNTASGAGALAFNTTGSYNTANGIQALLNNSTGWSNTASGCYALGNNTTGGWNTASGGYTLFANTTGIYNTASGFGALYLNDYGNNNTANGFRALYSNTTGYSNVAVGIGALYNNATRSNLVAVGDSALFNNEQGGYQAFHGAKNTAVGSKALFSNTIGSANTAGGGLALYSNTEGAMNTANGYRALYSNSTGIQNTALGSEAGNANSTGSGNVFLGYRAGYSETGSNKLYIANSSTNPPLIYGDFSTGKVGLGTTSPHASAKLEVSSTNQGFLPPRMTKSQRTAITSPAAGLLVFQTDAPSGYYYYTGTNWVGIEGSGAGAMSSCIDYDGNAYPTFSIGSQVWMAENLRVTHYRNGDAIPNVTDNSAWAALTTGAYCWYDNDQTANAKYGTLYNWYTVADSRGLCPTGWHEPTDAEWTTFTTYLGGQTVAGGKIKSVSELWVSPNKDATNNSGFSGLPGGYRDGLSGGFGSLGSGGTFWSSSQSSPGSAWCRSLIYYYTGLDLITTDQGDGRSVRCLKD